MSSQYLQLLLEQFQFPNALGYMTDVGIEQHVDPLAVGLGCFLEAKERADFSQGHVERTAVADECEALNVLFTIAPVVVFRA
ncbi:hypothetical protein A9977_00055 [Variovorax sp. UMC13]|nr:hypothetical protein [Variovorax sp. UMC13]